MRFNKVAKHGCSPVNLLNIFKTPFLKNTFGRQLLKHVDILVVCKTKLDETFPNSQFHVGGFSLPYGMWIFVKKDIPSKLYTKRDFQSDIEGLFVELNFRKSKWLLFGTYHLPAQNEQYFFNYTDKAIDIYSNYDNVLLAGDFSAEDDEILFSINMISITLLRLGSCFKNSFEKTSIDLFLTQKCTFSKCRSIMQWSI